MSDPKPLHQELYLPTLPPELLEELKKSAEPEQSRGCVVIDLLGEEPEKKTRYNSD